jgi:hypothetical protein
MITLLDIWRCAVKCQQRGNCMAKDPNPPTSCKSPRGRNNSRHSVFMPDPKHWQYGRLIIIHGLHSIQSPCYSAAPSATVPVAVVKHCATCQTQPRCLTLNNFCLHASSAPLGLRLPTSSSKSPQSWIPTSDHALGPACANGLNLYTVLY